MSRLVLLEERRESCALLEGEAVLRIVLAVPLPTSMSKFKIYLAAIVFLVFFVLNINTKNNLAHSHVGRNTGASNDLSLSGSSPS